MTVRASMQGYINRVRVLANLDALIFTDDALQDALDRTRTLIFYLPLDAVIPPGGANPTTFYATADHFEASAALQLVDADNSALTPLSSDLDAGIWTFANTPTRPVYVSGYSYDLTGAAINAAEDWLSRLKLEFDISAKDSYSKSQQFKQVGELLDRLTMNRQPIAPRGGGWGASV